jgi:hypothetical protein
MTSIQEQLASASQRAPGSRRFELLSHHDQPRIEAFLLSFDLDQRRAFFGTGASDAAIRNYCGAIDWDFTTMIARSGPCCLEAVATLVSIPPYYALAEFHVACPLRCNQQPIMAELTALAIEVGAVRYQGLIVLREFAHPDLLVELRENPLAIFDTATIRIDLSPRTHAERRQPFEHASFSDIPGHYWRA